MGDQFKTESVIGMGQNMHLLQLGILVVNWSYLTFMVENLVWALLETTESKGRVITSELNFIGLCDTVATLAKHYWLGPQNRLLELQQLMKKANKIRETRNDYIHGFWWDTNDPDLAYIEVHKRRGKKKFPPHHSVDDIKDVADLIWGLCGRISLFLGEHNLMPKP